MEGGLASDKKEILILIKIQSKLGVLTSGEFTLENYGIIKTLKDKQLESENNQQLIENLFYVDNIISEYIIKIENEKYNNSNTNDKYEIKSILNPKKY